MLSRLIAGLSLLLALQLGGQTTLPDLQARLLHKPLYLRGQWHDDKLKFDSTGHLLGTSAPCPFTLSGMEVRSLSQNGKGLRIKGDRVGLEFAKDKIIRTSLSDSIQIEVEAPPDGDYTTALDAIFLKDLSGFIPALPAIWQGSRILDLLDPSASPHELGQPAVKPAAKPAGLTAPMVVFAPEPQYNAFARAARLSGNVLIYLQVDRQGFPQRIRILHPLGLGLDELAASAVSQYRFKPALQNGQPVATEMNIEVNFQIF